MSAAQTTSELSRFERRIAGSNAERRAASWLAEQLSDTGRELRIEPFWCRPNWALAHAWHVALGLAGSLVAVHSPRVGGALLVAALLSIVADVLTGISPGRRLTPERASQNVVATPAPAEPRKAVRVILTANYDAGRTGLVYRERPRALAAALRRAAAGRAPGWLGWLAIALTALVAIAVLRLQGASGTAIGVVQLLPTIALVLALALLIELGTSEVAPAAGDNATGVATTIALARALDAAPPRSASIEVVLQGAGDTFGLGLRRYLRAHKRELRPANVVVLGVAACAGGTPRWWLSDGQFVPLRYASRIRELCERLVADEPGLGAAPYRGRGATPALQARAAQLPAIAIGCLDSRGLAPHSHQADDTAGAVHEPSLDSALEFGLLLVDAIDGFLARTAPRGAPARAATTA
jgi:hypothetical protein